MEHKYGIGAKKKKLPFPSKYVLLCGMGGFQQVKLEIDEIEMMYDLHVSMKSEV